MKIEIRPHSARPFWIDEFYVTAQQKQTILRLNSGFRLENGSIVPGSSVYLPYYKFDDYGLAKAICAIMPFKTSWIPRENTQNAMSLIAELGISDTDYVMCEPGIHYKLYDSWPGEPNKLLFRFTTRENACLFKLSYLD